MSKMRFGEIDMDKLYVRGTLEQPTKHKSDKDARCDLISRQDAIDAISKAIAREPSWNTTGLRIAKARISDLPSAQKKGEWIRQDFNKSNGMIATAVYHYPKCSICGASANYTNYCPRCGADMRGETNE